MRLYTNHQNCSVFIHSIEKSIDDTLFSLSIEQFFSFSFLYYKHQAGTEIKQ